MASSLSFMPMQLSADAEDWVWGRWYWAKAGAKPLALWTAYGHPLWEDVHNRERPGPQFRLDSSVYAPSRTSQHPGDAPHGDPLWYEDGLPVNQRLDVDAGPWCGGELWDSTADVGAEIDVIAGPWIVGSSAFFSTVGLHLNTKPAGVQAGDLVVIWNRVFQSLGSVPPLRAGFTSLTTGNSADGAIWWRVSYKIAGASEPANWAVLTPGAHPADSIVCVVRGHAGPPTVAATDGLGPSVTSGGLNVAGVGGLLLMGCGTILAGGNTWTAPPGMQTQQVGVPANDWTRLFKERLGGAGATGTRTAVYGPAARFWAVQAVGIDSPET